MVSARVLNEFCKMSASPAISRNLNRIKRNLFDSSKADLLDQKSTFNEMERAQELATQKWGFDFRADCPLRGNPSFIWERVSSQESHFAPQMYTLTRAAHVRPDASGMPSELDTLLNERADREHLANSSLDSNTDYEYDSQDETPPVASTSAAAALIGSSSSATSSCNYTTQQRKRQLKITEFMKERKRLTQAPKKISPAKRMRTSSGSNNSSSSVAAHFGSLLKRPRN